jgi:hypothetical protein
MKAITNSIPHFLLVYIHIGNILCKLRKQKRYKNYRLYKRDFKVTCKGICIRHKALGRYNSEHKRCQQCEIFIKWYGLRCPCCGSLIISLPICLEHLFQVHMSLFQIR